MCRGEAFAPRFIYESQIFYANASPCLDVPNSPKTLSKNASPCPDVSNSPKTLSKNASPCPDVSNSSPYPDVSSPLPPKGTQSGSLGAIVQNLKSVSTRKINRINSTSGETIWQRNYHDRIIRDEKSLHHIRHYITENPHAWTQDPENLQKLTHPSQKAVDSTSPKAEFIF
jgi:hypothetical protein